MAYPFSDLTVDKIDIEHVLKVLRPIWDQKPNEADRIRARIETVLDVAKAKGLRTGENPARWDKNLKLMFPAPSVVKPPQHYPSLPYNEIPAFMAELWDDLCMSADALEWAILN